MIAAAVFLQGGFAGFAIAMSKLFVEGTAKATPIQVLITPRAQYWELLARYSAHRCHPYHATSPAPPQPQRWSYVAATYINCAWISAEAFIFSFIVLKKRGLDAPPWVAIILCFGFAAFSILVMSVPVLLSPLEPPFTTFGVTATWALLSIAVGQARKPLLRYPDQPPSQ